MKYIKKYTGEIIFALLFLWIALMFAFAQKSQKPYKEFQIKSSGWR